MTARSPLQRVFVLILATLALMVSACDPNSLYGELTGGGPVCEKAATGLADCCKNPDLALRYPNACAPFSGGLDAGLASVSALCVDGQGAFGADLQAAAVADLGCDAALGRLNDLWVGDGDEDGDAPLDGDEDGDKPTDGDQDEDGDAPDGDESCQDGFACDDDDPCTLNDVCDNGVCRGEEMDCGELDDICNIGQCVDGACRTVPIDDETPCGDVDPQCASQVCRSGNCELDFEPDDTTCDDADPCTVGDSCQSGVCTPTGPMDCSELDDTCNTGVCADGSCIASPKDDYIPCQSDDACVTQAHCFEGECFVDSRLDCTNLTDDCNVGVCTPDGCLAQPRDDDTTCDDGDPCSVGDRCRSGICQPVGPKDCSSLDGECVTGVCDEDGTCVTENREDDSDCDDADACTVGDRCLSGVCQPLGQKDCTSFDDACNIGVCTGGECGAQPRDGQPDCDDEDACTLNDYCIGGTCSGHESEVACDDQKACTDNVCNPADGTCSYPLLADYCLINGSCVSAETPDPDETQCRWCDPQSATDDYSNRSDGFACNDGNACTSGDTCQSGACSAHTGVVSCDDERACTEDICNPSDGTCSNQVVGDFCLIGNLCIAGGAPDPDSPDCRVCIPSNDTAAYSNLPDTTDCTDEDQCTLGTFCENGQCTGVSDVVDCSDGLTCTDDLCNPLDGACSNPIVTGYCLINDTCVPAGLANPSQSVCAFCDPTQNAEGWTARNEGLDCSSNLCNLNDQCVAGVCTFAPKICPEDGVHPCWKPTCFSSTGTCSYDIYGRQGESCDPGDVCVSNASCSAGDCLGDGYDCSAFDDACHAGACFDDGGLPACQSDPLPEGTRCDDSDPATYNDACDASALCAGLSLPLSTDANGALGIRIHESTSGDSSPLCAQITVDTPDNEGLLVTLTSPALSTVTLHDHTPGPTPLVLSLETVDFAGQDRLGDWVFDVYIDDTQSIATVTAVSIEFASCPVADGDL